MRVFVRKSFIGFSSLTVSLYLSLPLFLFVSVLAHVNAFASASALVSMFMPTSMSLSLSLSRLSLCLYMCIYMYKAFIHACTRFTRIRIVHIQSVVFARTYIWMRSVHIFVSTHICIYVLRTLCSCSIDLARPQSNVQKMHNTGIALS